MQIDCQTLASILHMYAHLCEDPGSSSIHKYQPILVANLYEFICDPGCPSLSIYLQTLAVILQKFICRSRLQFYEHLFLDPD